jgi:hypothetical protein
VSKKLRIHESTPQPASSQVLRQETVAAPDKMDVDTTKAPATNATVMPAMGGVTENDAEDEDAIVFDDLGDFEAIEELES